MEARPEAVLTAPEAKLVAVFYSISVHLDCDKETYEDTLHYIDVSMRSEVVVQC